MRAAVLVRSLRVRTHQPPTCAPQCVKLEQYRGTQTPVALSDEFRHLTLQVIGESILSLTPEESDRVFPHLYLPIMARGVRSVAPARRRG